MTKTTFKKISKYDCQYFRDLEIGTWFIDCYNDYHLKTGKETSWVVGNKDVTYWCLDPEKTLTKVKVIKEASIVFS